MKPSFVTWQLRHLHAELATMDKKRGDLSSPMHSAATLGRNGDRDRVARRALLDRLLRSLPKRLGFRDARAFLRAFVRANQISGGQPAMRRRLVAAQIEALERLVMQQQRPAEIARTIGCAEQTVLNRATQLRKRLAAQYEGFASGI